MNRRDMDLLGVRDPLLLNLQMVLLHLPTTPTEIMMPDNLIRSIETGEGAIGVQSMGQSVPPTFGTIIIDLMNDGQDRLHTKINKVTLGEVLGQPLDQQHERNNKTGVLVQTGMSIGPCRVLLRMPGLDVACKFLVFSENYHTRRLRIRHLYDCINGGTYNSSEALQWMCYG